MALKKWRVPMWVYVEAETPADAMEEAWQALISPTSNRHGVDDDQLDSIEQLDDHEEVYE